MGEALKIEAVVGQDGKVEVPVEGLPAGTKVQVTVEALDPEVARRSLSSFRGAAKGVYSSAREVDEFIRQERESWGNRSLP